MRNLALLISLEWRGGWGGEGWVPSTLGVNSGNAQMERLCRRMSLPCNITLYCNSWKHWNGNHSGFAFLFGSSWKIFSWTNLYSEVTSEMELGGRSSSTCVREGDGSRWHLPAAVSWSLAKAVCRDCTGLWQPAAASSQPCVSESSSTTAPWFQKRGKKLSLV